MDEESDDLSAEIEFIEVRGTKTIVEQCTPCSNGIPNKEQNKCFPCDRDHFLVKKVTGFTCEKCASDHYSPPGSVGSTACKKRPPCTIEDYETKFTECNGDFKRDQQYFWREPKICNSLAEGAVQLPADAKNQPCRGCGRGEYRDDTNQCVSCENGYYQNYDNHRFVKERKIKECKVC